MLELSPSALEGREMTCSLTHKAGFTAKYWVLIIPAHHSNRHGAVLWDGNNAFWHNETSADCWMTSCMLFTPQLKILVEEDMFKVAVDGTHLLEYEHRVGGLEEVTLLRVVGDIILYSAAPSMIWIRYRAARRPGGPAQASAAYLKAFRMLCKERCCSQRSAVAVHLAHLAQSRRQITQGLHTIILFFFFWFLFVCLFLNWMMSRFKATHNPKDFFSHNIIKVGNEVEVRNKTNLYWMKWL